MDRFKVWLGEGLVLVPTVLLFGLLLFALAFQMNRLSNLAELLPADTEAFFVINMEDFKTSGAPINHPYFNEFLTEPFSNLSWFKRDFGMAWIDGSMVEIFELKSKKEAEAFFNGLVDGESTKVNEKDLNVRCFESQAICYRFDGDFVSVSSSEEALYRIGENTPRLEDNENYQNIRSRVGHFQSGFAYMDVQELKEHFELSLFTTSTLEIFPAWGASIKMEAQGWYVESFTSVNKELLGGAYFHPTEKYEQNFLPWTKSFAWEWGTQNVAAQLQRMREIFSHLGASSDLVFTSSVNSYLQEFFGDLSQEEIAPLLDGESYFGWTSREDFLFILELENEEDRETAKTVQEAFLHNFQYKKNYTDENKELKAKLIPLTLEIKQSGGNEYFLFQAEEKTVAALAFTDEALFVASTEEDLLSALARKNGQESDRDLDDLSILLPGSNEIWILDSAFLPETNILKTNLSTLTRLMSTRKIFDDGIFTRTSLLR